MAYNDWIRGKKSTYFVVGIYDTLRVCGELIHKYARGVNFRYKYLILLPPHLNWENNYFATISSVPLNTRLICDLWKLFHSQGIKRKIMTIIMWRKLKNQKHIWIMNWTALKKYRNVFQRNRLASLEATIDNSCHLVGIDYEYV